MRIWSVCKRGAAPHQLGGAALALAAACGGDSATGPSARPGIAAVAGAGVTDTVLAATAQRLVVEVRGAGGALVKSAVVRFEVRPAADSARRYETPLFVCAVAAPNCGPVVGSYSTGQTAAVDTTGGDGRAEVTVRPGTVAGPTYVVVTVRELGLLDSVAFTVQPGAVRAVRFARRDTAVVVGGRAALRASAVDAYGNARGDAPAYALGGSGAVAALDAASGTVTGAGVGLVYAYARLAGAVDSTAVRVVPAGRLLVYGSGGVYMVNTDGTAPRTVVTGVSSEEGAFPRFSPDGRTVALHTARPGGYLIPDRLVIADSSGSGRRDITPPEGLFTTTLPRPLADGRVLFIGRGTYSYPSNIAAAGVYAVAPDGTISQVAALPNSAGGIGSADISRDGARVAYVAANPNAGGSAAGLWVYTIATGQSVLIDANGTSPAWSPGGDRLLYLVRPPVYDPPTTLAVANADGTGRATLGGAGTFSPGLAWSPDGVYALGRVGGYAGGLRAVRLRDGASVDVRLPLLGAYATPGAYGDYAQPDWR